MSKKSIDSVDYIILNVGYAERLLIKNETISETIETIDGCKLPITIRKVKKLECKVNHNTLDPRKPGEYSCVNYGGKHCDCCSYYNDYPTESTWEGEESSDDQTVPDPFYPYQLIAIASDNHFTCDDEVELKKYLAHFPDAGYSFIVCKRLDGNPLKLADYPIIANKIDVLFCGCYSPNGPYDMEIILNEGKSALLLNYDTESG